MSLTKVKDIQDRLCDFDRDYYDQIYRQQRYQFGMKWGAASGGDGQGDNNFPFYPDIKIFMLAIGQSRRILNNALLGLSRVMTADVDPTYPQIDSTTGELRKQAWLERSRQMNYARQHEFAWLDFNGTGNGVVAYGGRRNWETKLMRTNCQYVPATQFLYDTHARSIGDARWAACVYYIAPEEAKAAWGEEKVRGKIKTATDGTYGRKFRYVRLTEYYDLGWGLGYGQPTYAIFLGDWRGEPVYRKPLPYEGLPIGYGEYMSVPGLNRPIGAILLQQSTQEAINELEAKLRIEVKRGTGFDLVDATQLHPDDLARLNRGDTNVRVRIIQKSPTGQAPYIRIPSQEVAQSLLALLNLYERQYNSDSQSSEMDRGSMSQSKRSATENALVDARTQQAMTLNKFQTVQFYRRSVEAFNMVAKVIDRDPLQVDINDYNLTINDPENPNLSMEAIMEETSRVLISPQAVEPNDVAIKQAQRLAALDRLTPFVGKYVNPTKYLEETLQAIGEKDSTEWLMDPSQVQATDPLQGATVPV